MKLERTLRRLSTFYLGRWYPIFCAALVLLGHVTAQELIFGGVLIVSVMLGLWICDDLRFAIFPFCGAFFTVSIEHGPNLPAFSRFFFEPTALWWFGVMAAGLAASLVAFVVRNRHRAKRIPDRRLFISMLIFSAALLTNGLFSPHYTVSNLVFVLGMIALLLGVYVLFAAFVRFDETAFDYFMYCLVAVGVLLSLEMLLAYGTTVRFEAGDVVKESVVFGWGTWTTMGCMLAMLMPASLYFAYGHKRGWIGLLIGFLEFFCTFLSQSRSALLIGAGILGVSLVILSLKGSNRRINRWVTLSFVAVGVLGGVVLLDKVWGLLSNYLQYGFADNGRFVIWRTGVEKFLSAPLFGSGFYDSYVEEEWSFVLYPYLYHNTLIQMLASCGIVGVLAYVWHRITTVRLVLQKPNAGKSFLGLCIAALLLFSLLDTILFNTYPMIFYALMLLFMEKSVRE